MGSLAGLPRDIWQLIAEKMSDHTDILRFGAVCKQWCSIVMDNLHLLPPKLPLSLCLPSNKTPPLPLLMQCRNEDEDEVGTIEFFSVSNNRNYSGFVVPEINKKWLAGSSHGWLFTIDIPGREIYLLNPLTRTQISLPSLSAFQHPRGGFTDAETDDFGFIVKAVISSDPSRRNFDDNCIVVAIISNFQVLSFCTPGDGKWKNVEGSPTRLTDVLLYNGQFYAVNELGNHDSYHICIARGDVEEDEDIDRLSLCDMGIYDLADGRVRSFDEIDVKFHIPPIWVSSSLIG